MMAGWHALATAWRRRCGILLLLLLALPLAGTPALAEASGDRARLDDLFAALAAAPDAATADAIDARIWRIWMVPADPELAARMAAVLAAEQGGDLATALDLLDRLVVTYPDYAEGWNQRATVEFQLGRYAASLADIDRVLTLEPRHFGALGGRVLIYLAEGNRPLAIRAMLAALAIHPFLAELALFPELQPAARI